MSDLFQEIDRDLRSDRLRLQVRRFGPYVAAIALILVIGIGAYLAYRDRQGADRAQAGERFAMAIDLAHRGDIAGASAALGQLIHGDKQGYAILARLNEAALTAAHGDIKAALDQYDALATDKKNDPLFRDLATILAGYYRVDTEDLATLAKRLTPLTLAHNPWHYSAEEIIALATLKAGDFDAAKIIFAKLSDDLGAPPAIRARATEILASLNA